MFTLDEMEIAAPINATVTDKLLTVELEDGRIISIPTKLASSAGTRHDEERLKWTLSMTIEHAKEKANLDEFVFHPRKITEHNVYKVAEEAPEYKIEKDEL